jgi:subtilase family serine protease
LLGHRQFRHASDRHGRHINQKLREKGASMPRLGYQLHAATAGVIAGVVISGVMAASGPGGTAPRAQILGSHPSWAVASRLVTGAAATGTVDTRVYLAGRDPTGLAAYAAAVSTPGNPLYGHYLSSAQAQARFGPSSAQLDAIRSWLTGAGLTVTAVNDHIGGYVAVAGSVTAVSKAFNVSLREYKGPDGRTDMAPEQAATVPEAAATGVLTVTGLDTASQFMDTDDAAAPPGQGPCSTYYGQDIATTLPSAYGVQQPWSICGYTPSQIRGAYGVTASGMTGRGQTVAIVDAYASPTMPADANQYATATGDVPFKQGQFQQYLPSSFTLTAPNECGEQGWNGEESVDVEALHGEAPDADIDYVAAASCQPTDLAGALAFIVDNDLASVVSASWGEPSDLVSGYASIFDSIFEAGAAEGIGFFFASGDHGYESPDENPASDTLQVDYPASSPWVTSVGGTSLAIGQHDNYEFETAWGSLVDPLASSDTSWQYPPPGEYPSGYSGSGGGGVSTLYQQPFYQRGVVPRDLATRLPDGSRSATPMRVVPDVSAVADPDTGFLFGWTIPQKGGAPAFSLSLVGGTSVSTPTFAGIEADAQQAAGRRLGFAAPAIYARYGSRAFHDVTDHPFGPRVRPAEVQSGPTPGTLRTFGINGEGAAALRATGGYSDATGVGSPRDYIQSFLPLNHR